ncbi:MAG: hypothetical protein LBT40_11660, partial [Deltaproteobacteria bacterium]|nr:hypothetical protein [Deltaproteobacteria bacterium]
MLAQSTPDGKQAVEFVAAGAVAGSVKDVYFNAGGTSVVALYRGDPDAGRRKRIEALAGPWRRETLGTPDGVAIRELFSWPLLAVEYGGREGYVTPIYPEKFRFGAGSALEGALKEGFWFASARNMRSVPRNDAGQLMGALGVCLQLCRAVALIHDHGLVHPGLSALECLVSPSTGDVCLTGLDWLFGRGHIPAAGYRAPGYRSPEEAMAALRGDLPDPSKESDLHALAVMIYRFLFRRHPLSGCIGSVGGDEAGPGDVGVNAGGPGDTGEDAAGPGDVGEDAAGPSGVGVDNVGEDAGGSGDVGVGNVGEDAAGHCDAGEDAAGPGVAGEDAAG